MRRQVVFTHCGLSECSKGGMFCYKVAVYLGATAPVLAGRLRLWRRLFANDDLFHVWSVELQL